MATSSGEAKLLNINSERRYPVSAQKGHPAPDDLYKQLRTYLTDGCLFNQKIYKDIQISYSLKHEHLRR